MKAKDTINYEILDGLYTEWLKVKGGSSGDLQLMTAKAQAEITFPIAHKVGYEQHKEEVEMVTVSLAEICLTHRRAGMEEVAKGIIDKAHIQKSPSETGKAWIDGYVVWLSPVEMQELKDWGIK